MKKIILTLCIFSFSCAGAQTIEQFFDWQWKPCEPGLSRFYSITRHTDSGWYRNDLFTATNQLQMKGLYSDSACTIKNGWFAYFNANGNLSSTGQYINNKLNGIWLNYHYNGMMSDSAVYDNGKHTGTKMGWHPNGYMADSSVYNTDKTAVHVYWFDNGTPSAAGRTLNNKKEGRWLYFHTNGKNAAQEDYKQDRLINRIYYNEEETVLTDTANKDRDAEFNGGNAKWRKFLEKNIVFPYGYKLVNTDIITVVVAAIIDEEGNVEDAFIHVPFNPVFDKEALRIIKKSPKWLPSIRQNRRVKMYIRQPISFAQESD